jgi:predicted enzyme related to lactoylglutathione lyase
MSEDKPKVMGPGFISITVSDVARSAEFYERQLGAVRDPYDFGPNAVAFLGWPAFAVSAPRPDRPPPSPGTTSIALWWRAANAQALYERMKEARVRIVRDPYDGPFGRTFTVADPDGYPVTIYERDQPLFWPPRA